MRRELLRYDLPEELIASHPTEARDGARLLVVRRDADEHARILDLPELVEPGTLVVVNDTRVVPARLLGEKRGSGGRAEIFLVRHLGEKRWRALGRASKPLRAGAIVDVRGGEGTIELSARVVGRDEVGGTLEVELDAAGGDVEGTIERVGHVPLPPYVGRSDDARDRERYQTVFAKRPGAVAAPTAGLHLSEAILERLRARDVAITAVTLHVGLGTFQPVSVDDLDDHPMHAEVFDVSDDAARAIERARARGAKILAIGTTVVRALESAASRERPGLVDARAGETRLLIQPGYRFTVVDRLLTNFHLPESTLLALVGAFAGRERVLAAYRAAIEVRYRFYSYGDAMLLDRAGPA